MGNTKISRRICAWAWKQVPMGTKLHMRQHRGAALARRGGSQAVEHPFNGWSQCGKNSQARVPVIDQKMCGVVCHGESLLIWRVSAAEKNETVSSLRVQTPHQVAAVHR